MSDRYRFIPEDPHKAAARLAAAQAAAEARRIFAEQMAGLATAQTTNTTK